MIAVRVRGRPLADVLADMVEGVLVANGLTGAAAARMRQTLVAAATDAASPASADPASTVAARTPPARVA